MKKRSRRKFKKVIKILMVIMLGSFLLYWGYQYYHKYDVVLDDDSFNEADASTLLGKLQLLSKKDKRIKDIVNNYEDYPEELLEMLVNNLEMLDFVIDYPSKKGKVYSDNVENIKEGEIPLLLQWDQRWGYGNYGNSSVAVSGCGPTSLAMVIVGLTKNVKITPYVVAKYAFENGYYLNGTGTLWTLMSEGAKHFGIKVRELGLSKQLIVNALSSGHPIICSMRKGDFTNNGHFIVLTGLKDGKIKVNDPNSRLRSNKLWDYETLKGQIKNLWEFYL